MTAEEYVKHYTSGQGGFESVSVDVALMAIKYAKEEIKQQLMKDAVEGVVTQAIIHASADELQYTVEYPVGKRPFNCGEKVKLLVIKEQD